MTLAQAGTYTGPDGIAEYVKFALNHSPYVSVVTDLATVISLKSFDAATGTCRFLAMGVTLYVLNPKFTVPGTSPMQVSSSYTIDYIPATNKINKITVYYDIPFLEHWFSVLDTDATRTFICEVMARNCSSTWALNNLNSVAECESKFANISKLASDATAHIDGNTRACRYLHGVFASTNPQHCPHLSFVPQQDAHGKTKCQTSANLPPGVGSFDGVDFVNMAGFKVAAGLDAAKGYKTVTLPAPPAAPSSDSSINGTVWIILIVVVALVTLVVGAIVGYYCAHAKNSDGVSKDVVEMASENKE